MDQHPYQRSVVSMAVGHGAVAQLLKTQVSKQVNEFFWKVPEDKCNLRLSLL